VIETTGAFANTKGGSIFIGVSDKGKVIGVQLRKETVNSWVNQIVQSTDPRIVPDIEVCTVDGKDVGIIWIKEFPLKPVSVKGRCFRRTGNSNRIMTPQEIAHMHLVSTDMSWDSFPAAYTSLVDIDIEKVKRYIKKANTSGRRKIDETVDPFQILEKLKLVKDGRPTLATIILFGKAPQETLVQATVHCGRFKQETIIIDDKMIRGTVIEQIEEVMDFIRKNTNVRFVITGKPTRDEVWDYPLDALREAVVNAICHRDYADNSDIQLKIHDNRFTIWNPGGLVPGMTIEELYNPNHSSKLRNKLIAQIFYDIELIERYGSGIQRIIDACKNAGLPPPVFEERFGGFLVIFKKDIYTEEYLKGRGLNERQIKAVIYAKEKGRITNKEYQEMYGIKKRQASEDLKDLQDKKIFERVGTTGKGTYYTLKGAAKGRKGQ
jgi:ATP-dependent DNA helicase RecG